MIAEPNQWNTARSLCDTCAFMREVVTPKGSRFLLCRLSQTSLAFPKYPPQPVVRCDGYLVGGVDDKDAKRGDNG